MAYEHQEQYLSCPYCEYGSYQFDKLERHCHDAHATTQGADSPQPGQKATSSAPDLNDFELAQLLAFEEAGLPSELALLDRPGGPANNITSNREGPVRTPLPSSQHRNEIDDKDEEWVQCVCGERVHFLELDAHADMHAQEDETGVDIDLPSETPRTHTATTDHSLSKITNSFTTTISTSLRNYDRLPPKSPQSNGKRRVPTLKEIFLGTPASPKRKSSYKAISSKQGRTRRLGRAELGPFAHEQQMPAWLERMLEEGAKVTVINKIGPDGRLQRVETIANETPNLIPVLARLSQLDRTVERAFYCSPEVCHMAKMQREGGFCGYRNIQMLVSYIQEAEAPGSVHFPGKVPNILKLQDLIEQAWDMGFNSTARVETGGIKFTRKYIGTPEAQALFMSLDIACEATAYTTTDSVAADDTMMCAVCEYFDDDNTKDNVDKVVITEKPPIYFQHQGHSMTIVGVETRADGLSNLVVFDPMFNPNPALKKLALAQSRSFKCSEPERLLKAHRRGEKYLSKYRDFELLKLTMDTPTSEE